MVDDPALFCNPVDKNGEGIQNPEAHLTCYRLKLGDNDDAEDEGMLDVLVDNQFGEQVVVVDDTQLLCVPSNKIGFEPHIDDDDDDDDDD